MPATASARRILEDLNPLNIAAQQFEIAADYLQLDAGLREMLRRPRRSISLTLPIKMDNGAIRVFDAYRVQHSNIRGPCKGGIRYHPNVTFDEVSALAASMTWMEVRPGGRTFRRRRGRYWLQSPAPVAE